jgi:hypothetical protein
MFSLLLGKMKLGIGKRESTKTKQKQKVLPKRFGRKGAWSAFHVVCKNKWVSDLRF